MRFRFNIRNTGIELNLLGIFSTKFGRLIEENEDACEEFKLAYKDFMNWMDSPESDEFFRRARAYFNY